MATSAGPNNYPFVYLTKKLGEHAARHEMRIAFEPLSPVNIHTDTSIWYLDQGIELVDRVNQPLRA